MPGDAPRRRHAGPRGFTLIEVLIAFAIAAAACASLVRAAGLGASAAVQTARYDEALSRAQSHLAELAASPLAPSDRQGDEGGVYHWHTRIEAAGSMQPAPGFQAIPQGAWVLYRLSVAISWQDGPHTRAVQLSSAQLGRPA